jgi:hypothetical protein
MTNKFTGESIKIDGLASLRWHGVVHEMRCRNEKQKCDGDL